MKNISSKLVPLTEQILGCIGLIMIVIETYAVFARNILHTSRSEEHTSELQSQR